MQFSEPAHSLPISVHLSVTSISRISRATFQEILVVAEHFAKNALGRVCVNSWSVQQSIPAAREIKYRHVEHEKWIVSLLATLTPSASASRVNAARSFYFQVHHVLLSIS